jgi:hypothetical protein
LIPTLRTIRFAAQGTSNNFRADLVEATAVGAGSTEEIIAGLKHHSHQFVKGHQYSLDFQWLPMMQDREPGDARVATNYLCFDRNDTANARLCSEKPNARLHPISIVSWQLEVSEVEETVVSLFRERKRCSVEFEIGKRGLHYGPS